MTPTPSCSWLARRALCSNGGNMGGGFFARAGGANVSKEMCQEGQVLNVWMMVLDTLHVVHVTIRYPFHLVSGLKGLYY